MKRWLLLQFAIRSYRRRLKAERRYSRALEAQLEGERARNLAREDELASVPMRMVGAPGLLPRTGRATPVESLRRSVERKRPVVRDAWSMLTEDERAEYPLYAADADPNGLHEQATKQEFIQMVIARREMERGEIM